MNGHVEVLILTNESQKFASSPTLRAVKNLPTYILLSKLTSEGRRTLRGKPNRVQEVNKEIEALGARIVAQYAVLGPYDFVNVVEAPDNKTVARVSVELGARGTVEIMTLPAISIEEFLATMRKR